MTFRPLAVSLLALSLSACVARQDASTCTLPAVGATIDDMHAGYDCLRAKADKLSGGHMAGGGTGASNPTVSISGVAYTVTNAKGATIAHIIARTGKTNVSHK